MANAAQFDTAFYLSTYPDVAVAISRGQFASAEQHYNQFGRFESRNPNAYFDTTFYLTQNADVAANRGNPFEHFVNFGSKEGRFSNAAADAAIDTDGNNRANEFNSAAYLAANQDVAANVGEGKAFATAYQHFILFGQFETRAGTPAGGPFTNTGTAPNTGSTIVLTTGLDIVNGTTNTTVTQPASTFATVNNDTIVAVANAISAGDQIDGLAGIDTLKVTANGNVDTTGATIANIEVVELNDAGTFTNAELAGVANLTTVNVNGSNNGLTVEGLKSTVAVNATNLGGDLTLTYSDAAATGKQTAGITVNGATTGTVSAAGIETLNLSSTGAASTLTGVTAAAATALTINAASAAALGNVETAADATITVSGAGAVSFTNSAGALKTIDASASTGGVNVQGVVASVLTFTGGAGNDRVALGNTLATTDTLVGGAGTDTVAIAGVDLTDAANVAQLNALNTKVTGFEALEFTGSNAATIQGGTGTGAFTNTEITKLVFNTADAGTDTINNAGSARIYAFGDANSGAATLNLGSGVNTVNLSLEATNTPTTGGAEVGGITVNANGSAPAGQTATVNIASIGAGDVVNSTGTLTAAAGSIFNVTGSHDLTISGVANGGTIDASTFTGKLVATGSGVNDIITGGTNNDTLTGGAGIDTINGGAGNDTITGGTGADVLTGGAGADIFKFAAGDSAANGTAFDTITDFAKASDVIDHTASITFVTNATASAGVAAINAEGIATFNAADTTLAQQITAVEAAIQTGTATAGQAAIFQSGADSYVFISDGTDGVGANDVLIKLTGVTGLTDSTLTSGDLTIA